MHYSLVPCETVETRESFTANLTNMSYLLVGFTNVSSQSEGGGVCLEAGITLQDTIPAWCG